MATTKEMAKRDDGKTDVARPFLSELINAAEAAFAYPTSESIALRLDGACLAWLTKRNADKKVR